MAKIKTNSDFAPLFFSLECREWRLSSMIGPASINHAERYCSFEREEDAVLFEERWREGYTPVLA